MSTKRLQKNLVSSMVLGSFFSEMAKDMVGEQFAGIGFELQEFGNYSFYIEHINGINFQKIADDLSYSDPLRIVRVEDRIYAVVHHTIFDKYKRSVLTIPISNFIRDGRGVIEQKQISVLIKEIRKIKQSEWLRKNTKQNVQVDVVKVKI